MDENTTKLIKEKFDALPETIKEAILSSDYEETLIQIGQENQLNVEEMGILERETTLVMMGLTPVKDFQTELTRELKVDVAKGSKIVKEINDKVFLKIRELLKLMNTPEGEEPSIDDIEEAEEVQTKVDRVASMMPDITPQNVTEENIDHVETFRNAGIEILPDQRDLANNEKIHSVLAQKLSGPMSSIKPIKTEHTLGNLTPSAAPSTPQGKPVVDPYREIPQ